VADLKKTVEILFQGDDQASSKAAQVIDKVRSLEDTSKGASVEASKLGDSLEGIGKKSAAIDAASNAIKALAASLVVNAFIDANVALERFERGLRALNGASADTAGEWRYVVDLANRLGLELRSTADAYLQLSAATKGTALEGEQTREIFEAVSKAMGALGKSSADTEGALLAISQIVSKGTVSLEELRGQLGERLPGAFQLAAKSMGVTTEELDKLVSSGNLAAVDFLPRFAQELNRAFGGAEFEGYTASLNRLRNTIDAAFVNIGKAGAFDVLIGGIKAVTATITGAVSAVKFFGELIGNFLYLLETSGNSKYGIFGADWKGFANNVVESLDKAAAGTQDIREAFTSAGDAGAKAGDQIRAGMEATKKPTDEAGAATKELDALLKKLGVDPKKTSEGIAQIAADLEALAKNPKSNGEQFALAFEAAIKKAANPASLSTLQKSLFNAFESGKISAEQLEAGLKSLDTTYAKLEGSGKKAGAGVDEVAKAMERQAKETKEAEEKAQAFRLEMEKLASNERIKLIEAKVTLNVAQIEADTKRIEASFESINNTVTSTGDLLGDLFGLLKDYDSLSFAAIRLIEKQIEQENAARQSALGDQRKLIDAQIKEIQARTRAIEKGDSVIKVDGAGLQPHLEAFMWEILRTIQVRANRDGLAMLLGN
jgi:tape measure domain-containing protein